MEFYYYSLIREHSLNSYEKVKEYFEKEYSLIFKEDPAIPELYLITFDDKTDLTNETVKTIISNIYEKGTNKVICSSYKLSYDAPGSGTQLAYTNNIDFKNVKYYKYNDGTLIRRYHYKGNWLISTCKCINAFNSYWLSMTFGDLFTQTVAECNIEFVNEDTNFTYLYLLQHPQNRIVKKYTKPNLVYLGKKHNLQLVLFENEELNLNLTFNNMEEINNYINKLPYDDQALILKNNEDRVRIFGTGYMFVKSIRGNTNSMLRRYIEVLNDEQQKNALKAYYSEYGALFVTVETDILNLAKRIKAEYINRYIYHNQEHSRYYHEKFERTLKQLHAQYLRTRKKISLDIVYLKLTTLPSHVLYWLLGY